MSRGPGTLIRKAVYAGSFDPITYGHMWMIRQGGILFDELVVAVGINPDKKSMFTVDERLAMIRQSINEERGPRIVGEGEITIDSFENLYLVDYASRIGAGYILRGIRNENDYTYERGMRHVNEEIKGGLQTVFLMPPREISEVSSSLVKGLIGPDGWERIVREYVPRAVYMRLLEKTRRA